jgi:hypothetical protein
MLDFGMQLAQTGAITNYGSVNHMWDEIVLNEHNDWEYFKGKYQIAFNAACTQFRLVAPKA